MNIVFSALLLYYFIIRPLPAGRSIQKGFYIIENLTDLNLKSENDCVNNSRSSKLIILFNEERKRKHLYDQYPTLDSCSCSNCEFTTNQNGLQSADAVIFNIGIRNERMGTEPPIPGYLRNANQVWIFVSNFPPVDYYNLDYERESWYNTMNWSISYTLNSDIVDARGYLLPQDVIPGKDYKYVYNRKTRNALWLVRQCQSSSARRQYITEMTNHGFEVDMLGVCGNDGLEVKDLYKIIPKYKFYLAFETALCDDFISEKFFRNYNHDWIIVVRGGADYHKLIPTNTYINTADFKDISSLVAYLMKLGSSEQDYINFLQSKDRYKSIVNDPDALKCEICKRLNNLPKYRKTFSRMDMHTNISQCRRPNDL
ncbi:alpha-(1,3)-fucosyltransferase C-like [Ruditapes philippinarum]|uniref:alpha-(1,3)-fucosyltransferase C-like n=1 Tax=Ruditapes philippinarum TaxID=129788 RepID=UPI00295AD474|nr:alpha-(1,3)-fucosyltransferase C-like [Ruditapes philippinarum]